MIPGDAIQRCRQGRGNTYEKGWGNHVFLRRALSRSPADPQRVPRVRCLLRHGRVRLRRHPPRVACDAGWGSTLPIRCSRTTLRAACAPRRSPRVQQGSRRIPCGIACARQRSPRTPAGMPAGPRWRCKMPQVSRRNPQVSPRKPQVSLRRRVVSARTPQVSLRSLQGHRASLKDHGAIVLSLCAIRKYLRASVSGFRARRKYLQVVLLAWRAILQDCAGDPQVSARSPHGSRASLEACAVPLKDDDTSRKYPGGILEDLRAILMDDGAVLPSFSGDSPCITARSIARTDCQ